MGLAASQAKLAKGETARPSLVATAASRSPVDRSVGKDDLEQLG